MCVYIYICKYIYIYTYLCNQYASFSVGTSFSSSPEPGGQATVSSHVCKYVCIYNIGEHIDVYMGAPLRLPRPLSVQFHVRVCAWPLCIINRL